MSVDFDALKWNRRLFPAAGEDELPPNATLWLKAPDGQGGWLHFRSRTQGGAHAPDCGDDWPDDGSEVPAERRRQWVAWALREE